MNKGINTPTIAFIEVSRLPETAEFIARVTRGIISNKKKPKTINPISSGMSKSIWAFLFMLVNLYLIRYLFKLNIVLRKNIFTKQTLISIDDLF